MQFRKLRFTRICTRWCAGN